MASERPALRFVASPLVVLAAVLLMGVTPVDAHMQEEKTVEFTISNYTRHYGFSPDHRRVYALGLSSIDTGGRIRGGGIFSNSFGQPSAYGFVGRRYNNALGLRDLYYEWTAGIMYGYRPPHEDSVPLNFNGFSPAIVPSIGYQIDRTAAVQVSILGTAALMFRLVFTLP